MWKLKLWKHKTNLKPAPTEPAPFNPGPYIQPYILVKLEVINSDFWLSNYGSTAVYEVLASPFIFGNTRVVWEPVSALPSGYRQRIVPKFSAISSEADFEITIRETLRGNTDEWLVMWIRLMCRDGLRQLYETAGAILTKDCIASTDGFQFWKHIPPETVYEFRC